MAPKKKGKKGKAKGTPIVDGLAPEDMSKEQVKLSPPSFFLAFLRPHAPLLCMGPCSVPHLTHCTWPGGGACQPHPGGAGPRAGGTKLLPAGAGQDPHLLGDHTEAAGGEEG
ncbi:GAS8 isoform 11 [Pongo abelii]|uniref:GAS8 isoform 11 n=1 Tax=Pongo abelii TaxID=9601 RepID=A0A2J8RUZ5_PONAB|nr:GAS8 isoform 11 [Pongo abelii]